MDKLKQIEWLKILKGALIAGGGAALTYLLAFFEAIQLESDDILIPVIVAGLSAAIQAFRKITITPQVAALFLVSLLPFGFVGCHLHQEAECCEEVSIDGPSHIETGTVAVFQSSCPPQPERERRVWSVEPHCPFREAGCAVYVAPLEPGEYTINLSVTSAIAGKVQEKNAAKLFRAIGKPQKPDDDGGDDRPDTPDDTVLKGLALISQQAAKGVSSVGKASEAKKLAEGLRGLAPRVSSGELVTTIDIAQAAIQTIDGALGSSISLWSDWKDAVFIAIRQKFDSTSDPMAYARAWADVAKGLEALNG
ncbi:Hypothetical protein PBC10988_23220 [Planctomycetales bacterium 10988]|nr:Hypothetical protein PBC10988_23220 [Planctomycetales bacterium 10988]